MQWYTSTHENISKGVLLHQHICVWRFRNQWVGVFRYITGNMNYSHYQLQLWWADDGNVICTSRYLSSLWKHPQQMDNGHRYRLIDRMKETISVIIGYSISNGSVQIAVIEVDFKMFDQILVRNFTHTEYLFHYPSRVHNIGKLIGNIIIQDFLI